MYKLPNLLYNVVMMVSGLKNYMASKRGAMLMLLMVFLIIGGIVAMQMLPEEQTITLREDESALDAELSLIREAFDLANQAGDLTATQPTTITATMTWPLNAVNLQSTIASLANYQYLHNKEIQDPTVKPYMWGVEVGSDDYKCYWQIHENLLATDSSFEKTNSGLLDDAWRHNTESTSATTTTKTIADPSQDHYPYQNRFGRLFESEGSLMKVIRKQE